MRSFSSTGAIIHLIAGAMLLASTAARADELIVMPYACAVAGGKPVLTPSSDQGYSIVGRREQRDFSACSPVSPDVCRKWTVHRFDLDCGGARVPWVSVAAAADAHGNGRTSIENGRLQLEMPPWWSDPCAPATDADHRRRSPGFGEFCAERRGAPRRDFVEMPAGFAPMLGIDAIFVAAPKSHPASPLAAANQSSTKATRVEAPKPLSGPTPADGQKAFATAHEPTKPETQTAAASAESAAKGSAPLVPEIINRAPSQSGTKPADGQIGAIPQATSLSPEARAALVAATPPSETGAAPDPARIAEGSPENNVPSISAKLIERIRNPLSPAALAIGGLMTLGLFAVAWMVRRERAQAGLMPSRDIASVSLDERSSGQALIESRSWLPTKTQPKANNVQQQLGAGLQPAWGDAIPTTRDEALHVLGMGVTPDISETAVKKIVDGLRLSWHPDHAKDPADQEMRELRTKQINAAWEVLMGKRAQQ